eukprot:scaffold83997_cov69-Phaeocystis_antarctica.AAC.2
MRPTGGGTVRASPPRPSKSRAALLAASPWHAVAAGERAAGPLATAPERAAPAQLLSLGPVRRGVQW